MPTKPIVTNNIPNTTLDPTTYTGKVTIKATTPYSLTFIRVTPDTDVTEITFNGARSQVTFMTNPEDENNEYTVNGQTIDSGYISINLQEFEHVTVSDFEMIADSGFKVEITADDGYTIKKATIQDDYLETNQELTITDAGKKANAQITLGYEYSFKIIGETATAQEIPKTYTINKTLVNCTGTIPETIDRGSNLSITLNANAGYKFTTPPTLKYTDTESHEQTENFSILEETQAQISFDTNKVSQDTDTITINAEATQQPKTGSGYGSINVYVVDMDNLAEFANQRFFKESGTTSEGITVYENIDLGDYVNRIFRLFTSVGAVSTAKLNAGNYKTQIDVHIPDSDKITLDFGNITLPKHNDNITDFKNVYRLMLPFNGFIDVDNEYTGLELNLKYIVNVITGGALAVLSYEGTPILYKEVTLKQDIIYRTNIYYSPDTYGGDKWDDNDLYGLEPFIHVEWYESVDYGRNNDRKRVIIGGCEGFNVFSEIDPIKTDTMTNTEQSKIYELLEAGVYIEQVEA